MVTMYKNLALHLGLGAGRGGQLFGEGIQELLESGSSC